MKRTIFLIIMFVSSIFTYTCCSQTNRNKNEIIIKTPILKDSSVIQYTFLSQDKRVKSKFVVVDSLKEGYYTIFDDNGIIQSKVFFEKGQPKLYIMRDTTKVLLKYFYSIPSKDSFANILGVMAYDNNFKVDKVESFYFTENYDTNIINLNDEFIVRFKFYSPYKYRKICIGEINYDLNFIDSNNVDTFYVDDNNEFTIKFKPQCIGLNKIRGVLYESFLPDFRNVVNLKVEKKPIYIDFFVKDTSKINH